MHGTGIVMGMSAPGGGTAGAPVGAVLFVLFLGFVIVLLACLNPRRESSDGAEPARRCEWRWAWFAVLAANLPLPLIFGLGVTAQGGAFGMLAAVVVVWLIGHVLVAPVPSLRGPLVVGGGCVALAQVFPVLQIGAGLAAIEIVGGKAHSTAAAFAVTLLTAALLIVAALVCGFVLGAIQWVFAGRMARGE